MATWGLNMTDEFKNFELSFAFIPTHLSISTERDDYTTIRKYNSSVHISNWDMVIAVLRNHHWHPTPQKT
jgi:hypothetical protein